MPEMLEKVLRKINKDSPNIYTENIFQREKGREILYNKTT